MAARIYTAEMTHKKTGEAIEWDDLLLRTVREQFGRRTKIRSTFDEDMTAFLAELLRDAKNINPREPEEISKNIVDVNEKIYSNGEGGEDETTIKIV